jgi:hypothetical protein
MDLVCVFDPLPPLCYVVLEAVVFASFSCLVCVFNAFDIPFAIVVLLFGYCSARLCPRLFSGRMSSFGIAS